MVINSWSCLLRMASVAVAVAGLSHTTALAQQTASIVGTVSTESGSPLSGVIVTVRPGELGALTDIRGGFRISGVPAGTFTVAATRIGYAPTERTVLVAGGGEQRVALVLQEDVLELGGIVVSVSREAQRRASTPASVGVVAGPQMRQTGVAHPSEVIRQVPGAWVSVTAGEGHQTAIRQPLTTNPVYLFLEDGIPTRSPGFYNHNALYEVNLPQADRLEITKGPATALYGSDAIGGIINVGTRAPSTEGQIEGSVEGGSFGWQRLLLSASGPLGGNGVRAEVNLTSSDGWREATGYERQSGTFRWDRPLGAGSLRTVLAFSNIDQNTAGSSALREDDYLAGRNLNYTPISYRKVAAVRLSTEYALIRDNTLFTVTPFARWNEMDMIANWSLTYDPTVYRTGHSSLGMLLKARRDFLPLQARAIAGLDLDYSPGYREEDVLQTTREGRVFTAYTVGDRIYDYDVTYRAASPYLQLEGSPLDGVRVIGGLRMDLMEFDYSSRLDPIQAGRHRRPEDATVRYTHLSPKLGVTYEPAQEASFFANYAHGFRTPSEGQLFRQGQAVNSVDLKPVKVDSYEAGVRGMLGGMLSYELSAYHMQKTDDIINRVVPEDGSTVSVNAGETRHRGVEIGLGAELPLGFRADVAYSRAKHTYGSDLGGKEIETAPRTLANASLGYELPRLEGSRIAVEWTRVGRYWMDADNTTRYPGHSLLNLRAAVPIAGGVSIFGRIMNLTDERFAENAAYTVARGSEYAPGMPRTIYIGLQRN